MFALVNDMFASGIVFHTHLMYIRNKLNNPLTLQ